MAEAKKGLFGLGGKAKEEAADAAKTTAAAAASALRNTLTGQKTGTGTTTAAKPAAANTTATAKTTTAATAAKPAAAKPTTTTAAKPAAAATAAKPTAAKPAATAAKPAAVKTAAKSSFSDVPADAYYAEAVEWAVQKGITSGTTETTFNPDGTCHRGHVATFLWRAKGSPAPKAAASPFSDVQDGPFLKAILWAVENNIMEPVSATEFHPQDPCTRAQALLCLLRATEKPGAAAADVTAWAARKKLLTGQTGGTAAPCTRADAVTYLYRVLK